ncbi:MAG TPA: LLM class flavin-dependent oxidoreductase [Acidimicrobiia bacterium]|nr:LLM class flavin-dependent oxidoreductase [Acidimicrobiia bacterium]
MEVGVAIPQMAQGLDHDSFEAWCRGIDDGPFSSISAGERITFHNVEGLTACAAAAVLTERVRVFANLLVLPWHAPAMITKELLTIDVLSNGRLEIGVGVGGREQDYVALGSSYAHRHQRLDDAVAELRRLWAGGAAADGAVVGPEAVQAAPRLLAGAMGPKALARAAGWADGVSGFSVTGDGAEVDAAFRATEAAWTDAGREMPPRLVSGFFFALGPDADARLWTFTHDYLEVFGAEVARVVADMAHASDADRIRAALDTIEATGCDECILVPATTDLRCLDLVADLVADR